MNDGDRPSQQTAGPPTPARLPRFIDVSETVHFYNDEFVMSTNALRQPDDESDSGEEQHHDDEADDQEDSALQHERSSAHALDDMYGVQSPSAVDQWPSSYEEIFPAFQDLYLSNAQLDAPTKSHRASIESKRETQHSNTKTCKRKKATRAMAAFTRRMHSAMDYRYRKQGEFLRVCYQRALESEPEDEPCERVKVAHSSHDSADQHSGSATEAQSAPIFSGACKDTCIETVLPVLYPRKWPHLPFRDPIEWKNNIEGVISFLEALAELPESSLLYDPVDIQGFVANTTTFLRDSGLKLEDCLAIKSSEVLAEDQFAALLALLAIGVQSQSFSVLTHAVQLFLSFGQGTFVNSDSFNPRLLKLLDVFQQRLASFALSSPLVATYPRGLFAQWKVCSYQPSTSDAIATDGLYLYIFGRTGLLKIGTGQGSTVRDFVYMHNKTYTRNRDAERSWLCYIRGYLYCRTILMPGNRVDRICVNNLDTVEELFVGSNHSIYGKGLSESSVYAMITDGEHLYTIKCVDTQKRGASGKQSSRKNKNRNLKVKKIPLQDMLNFDHAKTDTAPKSASTGEASIRIGDRVVRGPDWKWSNQDGEKGSVGTVERISTWGGVQGSGVTVRWDKNQRVNTYRWGAEGCYDLIIVVEKDKKIIERKALPTRVASKKSTESTEEDRSIVPRHQFVLYRHDVLELISVGEMPDKDIDLFLDLSPSRTHEKSLSASTEDDSDHCSTLTALHSHLLSLSDSKTSWMCDGGTSSCVGDNVEKRYRCNTGCDYDLCEGCLLSTLIARKPVISLADIALGEEDQGETAESITESPPTNGDEKEVEQAASPDGSENVDETNPFATLYASLLFEPGTEIVKSITTVKWTEEKAIDELRRFWNDHYSKKECQIALRKNNMSLCDASAWLESCSDSLRKRLVIPTLSGIPLVAKAGCGALDPVLLIAGTFYASDGQLCCVSPPGLYAVGDRQSDQVKKAANSCDAAWFFSMETGMLVSASTESSPVLLKGIPAGSPTCVDFTRQRILVFSGYLNCLEEYVYPSLFKPQLELLPTVNGHATTLADKGRYITTQLRRLMSHRLSLPVYKQPRAGLEELLLKTQRASDAQTASSAVIADGVSDTKSKARRLKNIRGRLKELERFGHVDCPGYFVPFCFDFQEVGFTSLFEILVLCGDRLCDKDTTEPASSDYELLVDVLALLNSTVTEIDLAGLVTKKNSRDLKKSHLFDRAEIILRQISEGILYCNDANSTFNRTRSILVLLAQTIFVWGTQKGLFCRTSLPELLILSAEKISRRENLVRSYMDIMVKPRDTCVLENALDCEIALLRTILCSCRDTGQVSIVECIPDSLPDLSNMITLLLGLSTLECQISEPMKLHGWPHQTPVGKMLHGLLNYCSIRLYENDYNVTSNVGAHGDSPTAMDIFDLFAIPCIDYCLKLLQNLLVGTSIEDIRSSMVGTILPMVLATISNFSDSTSNILQEKLVSLLRSVGKQMSSLSLKPKPKQDDSTAYFHGDQIVESIHPYNRAQPSFRRVIHIPGATCLHFDFDPQCQTVGEADFVFVSAGHAWFHADRIQFSDGAIGESGGCFFGSYQSGNWPLEGLTISGDTATIMLCATSQRSDSRMQDETRRWGFKCTVRGLYSNSLPWSLDVSRAVVHACTAISDSLIRSTPMESIESKVVNWTQRFGLFDRSDPRACFEPEMKTFITEIAENKLRGISFSAKLNERVRKNNVSMAHVSQESKDAWVDAIHVVSAVLASRSNYISNIYRDLTGISGKENDEQELYEPIAIELMKAEQFMHRKVQLLNEWRYLADDAVTLDDMLERYAENADHVRELCELKSVLFSKSNVDQSVKCLYLLIKREKSKVDNPTGSSYQLVAEEFGQKSKFVLDLYAARDDHLSMDSTLRRCHSDRSTESSKDDDLYLSSLSVKSADMSTVRMLLTSPVSLLNLKECSQLQSVRLKQRLAGFRFLKNVIGVINDIKNTDLLGSFVGRILACLPVEGCGISSGCLLGNIVMIKELNELSVNYSRLIGSIAENDKYQLLQRAIVLNDYCYEAQFNLNGTDMLHGLDLTAILIIEASNVIPDHDLVASKTKLRETILVTQIENALWVIFRQLLHAIYDSCESGIDELLRIHLLKNAFDVCRRLFDHFMRKRVQCAEDAVVLAPDEALYRLVCVQMSRLRVVDVWNEERGWWTRKCLDLIATPNISPYVSIAAARLCRRVIELHGDSVYDLETSSFASGTGKRVKRISYGQCLTKILLERIGKLVTIFPEHKDLNVADSAKGTMGNFCVVIFESENAQELMMKAVEKVGEPDITSLGIPLDALCDSSDAPNAIKAAETDSAMIHRNVRCDGCNQSPLRGFRFKCFTCSNYDLCATCYMNQTHNVEHEFVRMSDSSGMGDLLQPRSKGGGMIPETTVLGSKKWKGSVVLVQLKAQGYALYRQGTQVECQSTAKELASLGFLVTVMGYEDLIGLDKLNHWESQVRFTTEPGSTRLNRRTSSVQKKTVQKVERVVIDSFNTNACEINRSAKLRKKVEVMNSVASELIALMRFLLSKIPSLKKWRHTSLKMVVEILEDASDIIDNTSLMEFDRYALVLGAANVLGGFREKLRIGGTVVRKNRTNIGENDVIVAYAFGNDDVLLVSADTFSGEKAPTRCDASELEPIAEFQIDDSIIHSLECLAPSYCSFVNKIHSWMSCQQSKDDSMDDWLLRTELGSTLMGSFSFMIPFWPTLFDNQIISTNGNAPTLLLQLAFMHLHNMKPDELEEKRQFFWRMEWIGSRELQYAVASCPIAARSFEALSDTTVYKPPPKDTPIEDASSDYFYNLFAYSSRSDLPQHSGRNKLLEYWEKNVIPAIESYVSGSFKSYEMDYFFAQLREPLREGNAAAALKIAFTLCDGHIPSGCHYPDPDTDWSALQIDDIEVGGRYSISTERVDAGGWPDELRWTIGQSGIVRMVSPSGMILMQFINPMTSLIESWWFHVDSLKVCAASNAVPRHSVADFEGNTQSLIDTNMQVISSIARKGLFDLLQVAPDNMMTLAIARDSPQRQDATSGNRYKLADLLRLAAISDLGCPTKEPSDETHGHFGVLPINPKSMSKDSLIQSLHLLLAKHFDRSTKLQHDVQRSSGDEMVPVHSAKLTKKQSKKAMMMSTKLSPRSIKSAQSLPPAIEPEPMFPTMKYRYVLMEALLQELRKCLDASSTFVQQNAFTVVSDSPPKPLIMIHVPNATCLILSFVVHPVLMDLPPGSSLEFFKDERCTNRIMGYFGEKRGLNYLPSLTISSNKCYVRISQGAYARYKFRVNALTADFGLAFWIAEELYHKLTTIPFSIYEVETILSATMSAIADFLSGTVLLPASTRIVIFQFAAKLINFAIGRGLLNAIPLVKLTSLGTDLMTVYENERNMQKGLFSLFTQQLTELTSLVDEVSQLKGSSSIISGDVWYTSFARMANHTRAITQGKRDSSSIDLFKRIYCGRVPIRDIEAAHFMLSDRDQFSERLIVVQKLPKTMKVAELEACVSRFILHLSLEECGEADDQSVYSAADVTRFGIVSNVLYLPVDAYGCTLGYAVVDVGREDIIKNLLSKISKSALEFEGEPSAEDSELIAQIDALCSQPNDGSIEQANAFSASDDNVWCCSVCTLENPITESECAACSSPIPPELAQAASQATQASNNNDPATSDATNASDEGWPCPSCTLVNGWVELECVACGNERPAGLTPPEPPTEDASSQNIDINGDDAASGPIKAHYISAVRFADAVRVSEECSVPQVRHFLRSRLLDTKKQEISTGLRGILTQEVAQYSASAESKGIVDTFAIVLDMDVCQEPLQMEELLSVLTTNALRVADENPEAIYRWMRKSGYDLQFEHNHYPSLDAASISQNKWTHQMDSQLISLGRDRSSQIGILTLLELCPSHIHSIKHTKEYSLIAGLETRDLRLRFAVLKELNHLLLESLPLVNLRPSSDPTSLRSRIVSMRQLIFPGVKIRFFSQTQDATSLASANLVESNTKRPIVTLDRLKIANQRLQENSTSLDDPQCSLFASTMQQLTRVQPSLLRAKRPTGASDPFVAFIVVFSGEHVVGEGGPYRQLFQDISNELLCAGNDLFIPTQNNVMKIGEYRERFLPRPSNNSKELLQMYEFVGILMGCCLRTGVRLNLRFAPIIWKMLVKQNLAQSDVEGIDWSLCESLKYLETLAADTTTAPSEVLYESFTSILSDGTIVELKPGGRNLPVTKENVKEYIRLVKATRLQECKPQVEAMLQGIGKIVPVQLLQLCVWTELQQWICGSLNVNVELLKRHTRYSSGMTPEQFPHLNMFWRVLNDFSEENKRRFINFAWGQDTLPADDAEFDRTHTRLLIKAPSATVPNQDALLPKADTCFFNIELPAYSSEEIMREKLLLAITMCTSLDGDDQTNDHDMYYEGDDERMV